jgi:RNA polymerase sigma-70 factor (ECF subfamily)
MTTKPSSVGSSSLRRSIDDPTAFSAFYEQHAANVLAFLARRTFEIEVARDLTAEAFAQAFISRKRFRGASDAEAAAWLYAIVNHLLSRFVRRGIVERRATRKLGVQVPELDDDDYERVIELAGLSTMRTIVAAEFEQLRCDQREAIRLRVIDEMPYPEVAACLAISEATARARVSRGLRKLALLLDAASHPKERTT